ncbi:MAG TPA: thioesterase family protein [Planctomycetota bacterium]|nr:thioesterase family protein [Planctomycetota bacterium]
MKEHTSTVRVRYGETDQMGVVYHANYFLYFELGRTELLRATGLPYGELEARGVFLVVTDAGCRYRAPARYDETLEVRTRVDRLGRASVRFAYEVRGPDGRLCADGHTELAAVDSGKRPVRLPEDVAARLR